MPQVIHFLLCLGNLIAHFFQIQLLQLNGLVVGFPLLFQSKHLVLQCPLFFFYGCGSGLNALINGLFVVVIDGCGIQRFLGFLQQTIQPVVLAGIVIAHSADVCRIGCIPLLLCSGDLCRQFCQVIVCFFLRSISLNHATCHCALITAVFHSSLHIGIQSAFPVVYKLDADFFLVFIAGLIQIIVQLFFRCIHRFRCARVLLVLVFQIKSFQFSKISACHIGAGINLCLFQTVIDNFFHQALISVAAVQQLRGQSFPRIGQRLLRRLIGCVQTAGISACVAAQIAQLFLIAVNLFLAGIHHSLRRVHLAFCLGFRQRAAGIGIQRFLCVFQILPRQLNVTVLLCIILLRCVNQRFLIIQIGGMQCFLRLL